jgi:gas vesicle protein
MRILSSLFDTEDSYKRLRQHAKHAHRGMRNLTSSKKTGVGQNVASLVVGLATGAAVGLLFAPTRGEEVRARIRSAAGKLGGRVRPDGGSTDRLEEQAVKSETSYDVGAQPIDDVGAMSRKAIERLQKTGPE